MGTADTQPVRGVIHAEADESGHVVVDMNTDVGIHRLVVDQQALGPLILALVESNTKSVPSMPPRRAEDLPIKITRCRVGPAQDGRTVVVLEADAEFEVAIALDAQASRELLLCLS